MPHDIDNGSPGLCDTNRTRPICVILTNGAKVQAAAVTVMGIFARVFATKTLPM